MNLKNTSGNLEIKLLKRLNDTSKDYWDANWIESEIIINILGFNAFYKTNLRNDELRVLQTELEKVVTNQKDKIEFLTAENGLYLNCRKNSKGSILCKIKATNEQKSFLEFDLEFEASTINAFIDALDLELKSFPLIGHA